MRFISNFSFVFIAFSVLVSCGGGGSSDGPSSNQIGFKVEPVASYKEEFGNGASYFFVGYSKVFFEFDVDDNGDFLYWLYTKDSADDEWSAVERRPGEGDGSECYLLGSEGWEYKQYHTPVTLYEDGTYSMPDCNGEKFFYIKERDDISGENIKSYLYGADDFKTSYEFPNGSYILYPDYYYTEAGYVLRVYSDEVIEALEIYSIDELYTKYPYEGNDESNIQSINKLSIKEGGDYYYLAFDSSNNIYYYAYDDFDSNFLSFVGSSKLREEVINGESLFFFDMPEHLKNNPQIETFITEFNGFYYIGEKLVPYVTGEIVKENALPLFNAIASNAVYESLVDPIPGRDNELVIDDISEEDSNNENQDSIDIDPYLDVFDTYNEPVPTASIYEVNKNGGANFIIYDELAVIYESYDYRDVDAKELELVFDMTQSNMKNNEGNRYLDSWYTIADMSISDYDQTCFYLEDENWISKDFYATLMFDKYGNYRINNCVGKIVSYIYGDEDISGLLYSSIIEFSENFFENNAFPVGSKRYFRKRYYTESAYYIRNNPERCSPNYNCVGDLSDITELSSKFPYSGEDRVHKLSGSRLSFFLIPGIEMSFDSNGDVYFYSIEGDYAVLKGDAPLRKEEKGDVELFFIDYPEELYDSSQTEYFLTEINDMVLLGEKIYPYVSIDITQEDNFSYTLNGIATEALMADKIEPYSE